MYYFAAIQFYNNICNCVTWFLILTFPAGETNWMQCNYCERWLHYECTGATEDELKSMEEREDLPYICTACKDEVDNSDY